MAEVETTVTFGKSAEFIQVWTNDPKWVRRIKKAGVQPTQVGQRSNEPDSYWFDVPAVKFVMRFRQGKRKGGKVPAFGRKPSLEGHSGDEKRETGLTEPA